VYGYESMVDVDVVIKDRDTSLLRLSHVLFQVMLLS